MNRIEKASTWIRHLPLIERADWLWNPVRPLYDKAVAHWGRKGLARLVNGTDRILVSPEARGTSETYEPDVWHSLMAEIRTGDTFVDVGAFIGLYAVGVGLRLEGTGKVVAFEPDRRNFSLLEKHVKLNGLEAQAELHCAAVSDKAGECAFLANGSSQARIVTSLDYRDTQKVSVVTLDDILAGRRIDLLKVDVEGFEEMVLRGAGGLLRTGPLRPRTIFIEVHPYAWSSIGSGSDALLQLLNEAGYRVETLDGQAVHSIDRYGEIIARI
jgi:FkbM family methyltransferase